MKNYVDYSQQSPTILSLCTGGVRGIERGLESASTRIGWRQPETVAYVEIEAFIIQNLVGQMEQGVLAPAPVWSNLKTFDGTPFRDRIDFLTAGYPCQPFSLAGERKGTNDPRHLYPYIERTIQAVRPVCCFFENVSGHLTMGFPEVSYSLRSMGYSVEAGIYTAEEVGAPHERERLFILAIRSELANSHSFKRGLSDPERRISQPEIIRAGEAVANTGGGEKWHILREFGKDPETQSKLTDRGSEMANDGSTGLQRLQSGMVQGKRPGISGPVTECRPENFPLGQGFEQREWEEQREVESSLGFTINGYNYREDLLRMAGNGVVAQTAELAFLDLLSKFK